MSRPPPGRGKGAPRRAVGGARGLSVTGADPPARRLDQRALTGLVGYHLRRADVHMAQHFARTLAEWDVRQAEVSSLLLIATNDAVTPSDLAQALNIKRPNLVGLLERLDRHGFITRGAHPRDKRSHVLRLTERGEALLSEIDGILRDMDRRVTACWSERERAQLIELLRRLYEPD